MPEAFRAPTLTRLHDGLCKRLVHANKDHLDVISSVDVQLHNTISEVDSMEWEFDLKDMWLTKSRWSMMARQYIDADEFMVWLEKVGSKIGSGGRGIAALRTKEVRARGGAATGHTNKETRRWGSCMLAISYKARPRPQITMYSRTSYLGYLAALDLTVAWMCARYVSAVTSVPLEHISFVWMNEALQYHNFKSLAYLLNHPDESRRFEYRAAILNEELTSGFERQLTPALKLSRNWMRKIQEADERGDTLGDMSYNTYRRIRRRYHTEVHGLEYAKRFEGWSFYKSGPHKGERKEFFKAYQPLPHCRVQSLDFSPIGLRLDGLKPVRYDGTDDAIDEEDEE